MVSTSVPTGLPSLTKDPVLLDVTRIIAHCWAGRQATGIDRVCFAYMRQFRNQSCAVVQHRGLIRILGAPESAEMFDLLEGPSRRFRVRITRLLAAALVGRAACAPHEEKAYLNIGHTDFDLAAHRDWIGQMRLRPFYFLHDLIPILYPEFSRPHAVRRHLGRVQYALEAGAGIILGTDAVRRDLEAFAAAQTLRFPPVVVAAIAGEDFRKATTPVPSVPAPYFLCIGTIEPRKNHRMLFDVWKRLAIRLREKTPRLVIAGQTGPMTGDIIASLSFEPDLQAHVDHRPACSDSELAGLLHHANALLVPSLAEGFGLPFVEALQVGTPVIASDLPVFREIGQGAARLLDPNDRVGWQQAILAAMSHRKRDGVGVSEQGMRREEFVPPLWSSHFDAVERFIATIMQPIPSSSERVLTA